MDKKTFTFLVNLPTIRKDGRTWLVLAIHEREHKNSYVLDCVADDGGREEFTTGGKGLDAMKNAVVTVFWPKKPDKESQGARQG